MKRGGDQIRIPIKGVDRSYQPSLRVEQVHLIDMTVLCVIFVQRSWITTLGKPRLFCLMRLRKCCCEAKSRLGFVLTYRLFLFHPTARPWC